MFLRAAVETFPIRGLEHPMLVDTLRSELAPLVRVEVRAEFAALAAVKLLLAEIRPVSPT